MSTRKNGFTLVELLIVVAIIGVIAAIAIPNLLSSLQRARQKRTMADIRAVAVALELYQLDNNVYPVGSSGTVAGVRSWLEPRYSSVVPTQDGWARDLLYEGSRSAYTIISFGSNGADDGPYAGGPTTRFFEDIVFAEGSFFQWPEGVQTDG
jgi:general secretion pathway protein G